MQGSEKILECLNDLLADELTAVSQYMVHAEMCANWGYGRLHEMTEKRAITEMQHAEKLIARLLFLAGQPDASHLKTISVGPAVPDQLANDREAEAGAIRSYNAAIKLAGAVGDNGTRILLEDILEDEEGHIDDLETQLDQIRQMGLQVYLAAQSASA